MPPTNHPPLETPSPSLIEMLRLTLEGLWPTPPDLTALIDRMETPR